jgi:hypothetical protein
MCILLVAISAVDAQRYVCVVIYLDCLSHAHLCLGVIPGPVGTLQVECHQSARMLVVICIFQAHESVLGETSANDSLNTLSNSDIAPSTQLPELTLPLKRKRYIPKPDDLDFQRGSWAKIAADVGIPLGPFQESNITVSRISKILSLCPKLQRIPIMIVYVKSFRLSDDGAFATVKDPSGEMDASIHHLVLDEFKSDLVQGSSLIIRNVSLFTVSPKRQVLNIVLRNVICVQPPPMVHLSTQILPNPVATSDDHPTSFSSSFQKLRDLQTPPSPSQVPESTSFNISPVRSLAPHSAVHSFQQSRSSETTNLIERFDRVVPSQAPEIPRSSLHNGTESVSSSSSSSQGFVLSRVVPGLSQYLAAKRARESAAASHPTGSAQIDPFPVNATFSLTASAPQQCVDSAQRSNSNLHNHGPFGAGVNSASSSGSSIFSSISSASKGGGPVGRQSPGAVHARASRFCDPDDESVLEFD